MAVKSPLKQKPGMKIVKLFYRVVLGGDLTLGEIGFLAVLKAFSGPRGICPSAETIATQAKLNIKTVWLNIRKLCAKGYLTRVNRSVKGMRSSNAYLLNDERIAEVKMLNAMTQKVGHGLCDPDSGSGVPLKTKLRNEPPIFTVVKKTA